MDSGPRSRCPLTRNDRGLANAPPPIRRGAGTPFPFFPLPKKENGAPGGARALRYGALEVPLAIGTPCAPIRPGVRIPASRRARPAVAGLRGPPPERCASRRSTSRTRIAPRPAPGAAGLISGPAARPVRRPRRLMRAARPASSDAREDKGGFRGGDNFFCEPAAIFETALSRLLRMRTEFVAWPP
jgi:hypothetical protein